MNPVPPAPRPARWRDIPRAVWILARAFAAKSRVGRRIHSRRLAQLHALAVVPFLLIIAIYSIVPGFLYLDSTRTGVAVAAPRRSFRSLAGCAAAVGFLVAVGVPLGLASELMPGPSLEVVIVIATTACIALLTDVMTGRRHTRAQRKRLRRSSCKLPAGERWELMMLAQLPGTDSTAVLLAHRLLRTVVPDHAVVTTVAHTAELHEKYVRYGFTPIRGRRLYIETPTHRTPPTINASTRS
ncbi:MAG: hypothetical protein L0G46_06960 [Kocuria sp.]|nr:hypothetical protein [Kocuria sp.]